MARILIMLSVVPILGAFLLGHFFGVQTLRKPSHVSKTLEELLTFLESKGIKPNVKFKRLAWSGKVLAGDGTVYLPTKWKNTNSDTLIAQALLRIGFQRLLKDYPDIVRWRLKVVAFGYILPPFLIVIAVFALVVGRFPSIWVIAIVAVAIATQCVLLWTSRTIEKEAARYATVLIEKTRMLARLSEEEALLEKIKAWTWAHYMPGICLSVALGNPKETLE